VIAVVHGAGAARRGSARAARDRSTRARAAGCRATGARSAGCRSARTRAARTGSAGASIGGALKEAVQAEVERRGRRIAARYEDERRGHGLVVVSNAVAPRPALGVEAGERNEAAATSDGGAP